MRDGKGRPYLGAGVADDLAAGDRGYELRREAHLALQARPELRLGDYWLYAGWVNQAG